MEECRKSKYCEFEGVEVTSIFTRRLFQEAINRVEEISLETSLKSLIK